jgi:hypothetical protein
MKGLIFALFIFSFASAFANLTKIVNRETPNKDVLSVSQCQWNENGILKATLQIGYCQEYLSFEIEKTAQNEKPVSGTETYSYSLQTVKKGFSDYDEKEGGVLAAWNKCQETRASYLKKVVNSTISGCATRKN